jgi:hypothetical protein
MARAAARDRSAVTRKMPKSARQGPRKGERYGRGAGNRRVTGAPFFFWPLPRGDGHYPGRDGGRLPPGPRRWPSAPVLTFLEKPDDTAQRREPTSPLAQRPLGRTRAAHAATAGRPHLEDIRGRPAAGPIGGGGMTCRRPLLEPPGGDLHLVQGDTGPYRPAVVYHAVQDRPASCRTPRRCVRPSRGRGVGRAARPGRGRRRVALALGRRLGSPSTAHAAGRTDTNFPGILSAGRLTLCGHVLRAEGDRQEGIQRRPERPDPRGVRFAQRALSITR